MVPVEDRVVVDEDFSLFAIVIIILNVLFLLNDLFNDPNLPVLPTHQHAHPTYSLHKL